MIRLVIILERILIIFRESLFYFFRVYKGVNSVRSYFFYRVDIGYYRFCV